MTNRTITGFTDGDKIDLYCCGDFSALANQFYFQIKDIPLYTYSPSRAKSRYGRLKACLKPWAEVGKIILILLGSVGITIVFIAVMNNALKVFWDIHSRILLGIIVFPTSFSFGGILGGTLARWLWPEANQKYRIVELTEAEVRTQICGYCPYCAESMTLRDLQDFGKDTSAHKACYQKIQDAQSIRREADDRKSSQETD